ncbi:MAG: S9 family peptidase, partial [Sphingomonadales bacterium]|nr:S9 family peptidase [Sphingomonadales bacterium]
SDTWINLHSDLTFLGGGAQFIWTSERTGYNHAYLYNKDGSLVHALTEGSWVLSSASRSGGAVRAVDEDAGYLYVTGSRETPLEKHLYQVPLAGGEITRLTSEGGWHDAWLSAGGSFFVDKGQSPTRPPYTAIRKLDGSLLTYIEENALDESHAYHPYLADNSDRVFGELQADDGTTLHYQMYLPTDFDENKKYPALVFHYGGPGPQMVRKVWQVDLKQVLAQNGYIVFTLDNRGSANRGKAFEEHIYHAMGGVEVRDQALGANYLKSLPYVDADNMGVFGWSYGGYMTLMMMLKEPDLYKAGIAGAPVVDWKLYDTHYTERYLGNPNEGDVYEKTSPITYVDSLKGDLLVIHGMADDNVFFDNTVMLMSALQGARKQFQLMTYPGKRHRITGEAETAHLRQMQLDFFNEKLKGDDVGSVDGALDGMTSPSPAKNPFPS